MLENLLTEKRNRRTMELDELPLLDILRMMNEEDKEVPLAVGRQLEAIERAVRLVIRSFQQGGRLMYVGAGTSGRLGVLDAVECPPTFGTDPGMVRGLIAGGLEALTVAVEGAEDNGELAAADLRRVGLTAQDTVIGLSASGRTPYVIAALQYARQSGANTVSIACNPQAEASQYADVAIEVVTGPEVLTGSTRLKAGTAQKLVLNMISTCAMIGIGKVYQNLMVDVRPTNRKLMERAKRIIMEAADVTYEEAEFYYAQAHGSVKAAVVMILTSCSYEEAIHRLSAQKGFVRKAIKGGC